MFKANNMRVILVLSVALFVLCSSVNMVPARSFLDDIKRYSKRQGKPLCSYYECESNNFVCFVYLAQSPELCRRGMYRFVS